MTKVEQLESNIMTLIRSDLAALGDWFQAYLADEWVRNISPRRNSGIATIDCLVPSASWRIDCMN
ncbi:MAG: hypothetical protein A2Z34_05290 [Planctomycetes bacterium RBG_16_59_8]|nr:MAG: hypothetical protein A2Z34_05290 [Planctomycetes bacterium RBG_16_59_8]